MHSDDTTTPRRADREGFTLVELLVAIIIVAILAAIITPAVMTAMASAKQAAIKTEIDTLHMAIMNYKNEYGSFPPAFETSGVGGVVHKHLKKLFPRIAPANLPNLAFLNAIKSDTAIYFWLSGFTDDPTDPLGISDSTLKRKKLFDFDQTRIDRTTNRYAPREKPGSPYLYVDSARYYQAPFKLSLYVELDPKTSEDTNGNNRLDLSLGEDVNGNNRLDGEDYNQNGVLDPGEDVNFDGILNHGTTPLNADTFQIICAGRDEKLGSADDLSNYWSKTRQDSKDGVK